MNPAQHPNVHQPWQQWSSEQTLHVAAAYSNPFRWHSRRELFNDFAQHMRSQKNVVLHVGELAYGDRPFEVTGSDPNDVQFRTDCELFHKENILCETIKRFPADWKYGAIFDGDFTCTRNDWGIEAIHMLQHHPWVQLFSSYASLSGKAHDGYQPGSVTKSFARTYIDNCHCLPEHVDERGFGMKYPCKWEPIGATGGCWGFTRWGYETCGGLMDHCILGHADWFMAFGLVCEATRGTVADRKYHPHYLAMILEWQKKAAELKKDIGVVAQFVLHHFHGSIKNRGYESRDNILVKHNFDPVADLKRNSQGILELTGNKPGLRDAIRRYFLARREDDTEAR